MMEGGEVPVQLYAYGTLNVHACIIYCDSVDLHAFAHMHYQHISLLPHTPSLPRTLTASHTHSLTPSLPHTLTPSLPHTLTLTHPPADGRVLKTIFATDTSSGSNILPIFPIVAEEIQVRRYVRIYKNNTVYRFNAQPVHTSVGSKLNIGAEVSKLSFAGKCDASMHVFVCSHSYNLFVHGCALFVAIYGRVSQIFPDT